MGSVARLSVAIPVALAVAAPGALASDPTPGPSSLPATVQAWLDAEYVPDDVPPDGRIVLGLTLWDTATHELRDVDGVVARVFPARGDARPASADGRTDWPGHLLFELDSPKGGPGRLEFRVRGRDGPLRVEGVGPPPDAPRTAFVDAEVLPIVGDTVAGRPISLAVVLRPRGLFEYGSLHLPDRLIAIATDGLGNDVGTAELFASGSPGTPYTGRLTIPNPVGATIGYAFPGEDGQPDQLIDGAATRIRVIEPGGRADAGSARPVASGDDAAAAPVAGDGGPGSAVWIVLAGLLVVAGALTFGGTVRRWLRRED